MFCIVSTAGADEQPSADTMCTQGAGHGHQGPHAARVDGGEIGVEAGEGS